MATHFLALIFFNILIFHCTLQISEYCGELLYLSYLEASIHNENGTSNFIIPGQDIIHNIFFFNSEKKKILNTKYNCNTVHWNRF